jgi:NADH-quinone oxidoreductase subunit E
MASELSKAKPVIDKYKGQKRALIPILQDVQETCNWLPPEVLEYVAKSLNVPLINVYSVATFFKSFSLEPRGEHVCTVCLGTACHVRGGPIVLSYFERKLGIPVGETSADRKFTLERVNCLGACALAPLVVVDGEYYGQMTVMKADKVLEKIACADVAGAPKAGVRKKAARKPPARKTKSTKPLKKSKAKKSAAKKRSSRRKRR